MRVNGTQKTAIRIFDPNKFINSTWYGKKFNDLDLKMVIITMRLIKSPTTPMDRYIETKMSSTTSIDSNVFPDKYVNVALGPLIPSYASIVL